MQCGWKSSTKLASQTLFRGFMAGDVSGPVPLPIPMAPDHWRSDYVESLRLGQAVTISILRDQRLTYKENYGGSTFTKFDGTRVRV
jgi:hypothetical protein